MTRDPLTELRYFAIFIAVIFATDISQKIKILFTPHREQTRSYSSSVERINSHKVLRCTEKAAGEPYIIEKKVYFTDRRAY